MSVTGRGTTTTGVALAGRAYALFFLAALGLTIVMLETDKNLQTDFGTVSSGYFLHWYVVLATGVADLAGAVGLLVWPSRLTIKAGALGSGLMVLVFLGSIATYSQVGFSSAAEMARYLFGIDYYGGDIRYLFDAVLLTYAVTLVAGLVLALGTRIGAEEPGRTPTAS